MPNIMINNICNLQCPYCFANEFVNNPDHINNLNSKGNITTLNFQKAVDFATKCDNNRIGIIGGEPTLHPNFQELMEILIENKRVQRVSLFTNGVNLDKHYKILTNHKFGMLVNLNSPNDIGQNKYDRIIKNLDALTGEYYKTDKITLGINMYKPDFDYEYILDALLKYKMKHVRTAIVVPNTDETRQGSVLDYFKTMKPSVFKFFEELLKHGIMPTYDCNFMPTCITTDREKEWLKQFWKLEKDAGKRCNITDNPLCSPVIDIMADLTAVRCFGLSSEEKVMICNFNDIKDLENYFRNRFDCFAFNVFDSYECQICDHRQKGKCMGGCLAFKTKKINQVYDFAKAL